MPACRDRARGPWTHDGLQGYTTTGVGTTLFVVRFCCPPEIAVIKLRRGTRPPQRFFDPIRAPMIWWPRGPGQASSLGQSYV
jgi:hypothetical protein